MRDVYSAFIHSLMILFIYFSCRMYRKENVSVFVSIVLSAIAVMLPFFGDINGEVFWSGAERLYEFVWLSWPIWITCLCSRYGRRLPNILPVLFWAALLHVCAGGNAGSDLCVPAIWIAESLLWTFALNRAKQEKQGKRYLMTAWLVSLLIFGCFTFVHISYLPAPDIWRVVRGDYWNRVIFLCWPVLLLFVIKITGRYSVWKQSLLYFLIVLTLIYFITNVGLNYGVGAFPYDIGRVFYCLALADIVFWNEAYRKSEQTERRVKMSAFMAALNAGVSAFLLINNKRLREVLSYVGGLFGSKGQTALQAEWIGYRKAAFSAFLSGNLSTLDTVYRKEHYQYVLDGHGLAAIRFKFGMLPLLVMAFLVVLFIIFLWNWRQKDSFLNQCARYLAIGYILKTSMAVVLQANMVVSPYMEFPFTGRDVAELWLPILLVYENYRRTKEVKGRRKQL